MPPSSWRSTSGRYTCQLEALAPHLLDENRQLQLAVAAHLERIAALRRPHLDRDIAQRSRGSRRALIWRDVTYLPSRPDKGEVFTPNVMRSVGASTSRRGSGRGSAGSVSVSPIVTSGSPATDTMSPGPASSMSTRSMPWAVWRLVTVPVRVTIRPGSIVPGRVVRLLADDRDALAHPDRPVADPADCHPADVLVRGQVGHEQLERMPGLEGGRRRDLDEHVE